MKSQTLLLRRSFLLCFQLFVFLCTVEQTSALPKWLKRFRGKKAEPPPPPPPPPVASLSEQILSLPWYIWWILFVFLSIILVVLYFLRQIGGLDRPRFVEREAVVWGSHDPYWLQHDKQTEYLYAIVALSTDREYGKAIQRLLPATSAAVGAAVPPAAPPTAALRYGAPTGADSLSVALYFDDPNVVRKPRWALGWLVAAENFKEAQMWAALARESWSLSEPLVAVRLGSGRVLNARIPWRHVLTPAIAPYLHWSRGFKEYSRRFPDRPSPVAAEFYVTGAGQSRKWMDYVIFLDDISHTWRDCGFD